MGTIPVRWVCCPLLAGKGMQCGGQRVVRVLVDEECNLLVSGEEAGPLHIRVLLHHRLPEVAHVVLQSQCGVSASHSKIASGETASIYGLKQQQAVQRTARMCCVCC